MGQLHLALLGTPEVYHQQESHDPVSHYPLTPLSFATRKTLALLVYLAVEEKVQPRERITALLWPDSNSELGRTSLRKTLAYLRQALGQGANQEEGDESDAHILASRDTLRLNPASAVSVDVWQLRAAAEAARQPILTTPELRTTLSATHLRQLLTPLQQAAHAYRGDFLAGFSLNDAPDFDDWATMQRELFHHQVALIFDRLSQLQFETGDLTNAIDSAVRWVAQDGLNEASYRRLMQLQMAGGNRSAALQSYQACRAMLEREFDAEPEVETEELAARIRNQRTQRRPHSTPSTANAQESSKATAERETPLVGRTFEHIQLVNAYRAIQTSAGQSGKVQMMTLEGEPGIGKTRLANEFLGWADVQGAHILSGRALDVHGRLPYQPVVEVLRLALPILQPRLSAMTDGAGSSLTKLWLAELSRLLPELHDAFPNLPMPRSADEAEVRLHLFEAIARAGSELAQSGLMVIFIDDLQWADAASLEVLQYCIRRWSAQQTPVLLIFALRAEELATNSALVDWLQSVRRDAPLTRLTLGLLTMEDTLEVVQAMMSFGETTLDGIATSETSLPTNLTSFSRQLFAETRGQPFFIVKMLRSLLEHASLPTDADPSLPVQKWSGEWMTALQKLPNSVRDLIQERLARLGANAQLCCGAAAVLGNRFDFDHLCHVSGLRQEAALPALEELLARNLWREPVHETGPERVGGSSEPLLYSFSHDRIRDVAYGQLSEARRRILHRLALEALAENAPPAELARHATLAAMPERAYTLYIEAGDAAMQLFAVHDAINFYRQALQLWQAGGHWQNKSPEAKSIWLPQLFHLYQQLGHAYQVSNQPQELNAMLTAMLALAQQESNEVMEVRALNRLATSQAHLQTDLDAPLTLLQRARQVAESSQNKSGLAETEWNLAQLHFYRVQPPTALTHAHAALALARELGERELLARTLNILAYLNSEPEHWAEVVAYSGEAYTIFMALNDRSMAVDSLCLVARGKFGLGAPQVGLEAARSAWSLVQELDNPWGKTIVLLHLATGLLEMGDYEEGLTYAQEAAEMAVSHHLTTVCCIVHILQGNILRAMGRYVEACQSHLDAKADNETMATHPFDAPVAMALCVDALLAGDLAEARGWAQQWLQTRATSLDFSAELEFAEWVEVMLRSGELALVEEEMASFGARFGHNPRYRIAYLRAQAVLAAWQGDQERALALWREAYALAGELGVVHEQRRIAPKLEGEG